MATVTRKQIYRRVAAEISAIRPDAAKPVRADDFDRVLPATLQETAFEAWQSPVHRHYVTKETPYVITFVDGVADLSTGFDDFLVESLTTPPLALIGHLDYADPFDYVRHFGSLFGDTSRTIGLVAYALDGRRVVTLVDGQQGVVQGDASVYNAGFIPTLADDGSSTLDARLAPLLVVNLVAKLNARPPRSEGP